MSFNDTSATTTINIGALIDTTATSTQNVRSLLAGSIAWSYATVEWFADATWTPAQITTLNTIFNTWGTVTGITFQQTTVQNDAEVILISDNNTNGFGGYSGIPADVPTTANQTFTDGSVVVSQTGQINIHIAPGGFIGSGTTNINIFDAAGNITRGGFELILHEIGHSLGLKHPHNGSTGNSLLWPGVTNVNDLGTNSLNQDLYTLMSYNFQVVPDGAGGNTLYTMATPMAYDIAAIQLLYGANTTFNSGDTTYDLATPAAALQWTSIWDTGGTDEIIYLGTNAATIDLRSATLDGTVGSGGYLSYFTFADGRTSAGFTIAGDIRNVLGDVGTEHGVIIENARTGSGNDTIMGNAADNTFTGGGGDDTEDGGDGNDTAVFSGSRLNHLATPIAGGAITIADQRPGMDGTDTLSHIESFRFDDGTFNQIEVLNRAPVIAADAGPHAGAERSGVTDLPPAVTDIVSASLSFTDANIGDTHTASSSFSSATWSGGAVPFATMTALADAMTASITADGTAGTLGWSFAIADQLLDFLAVTETLSVVYNLSVADHHVGSSVSDSDTEAVTILLTGANDVPTLVPTSILSGAVAELANTTASAGTDSVSGSIGFVDVDLNDRPTPAAIDPSLQAVTWTDATHDYTSELNSAQIALFKAAFAIAPEAANTNTGDVDWTYQVVDKNLDFLSVGEKITITTPVTIVDHNGGTVTPNVVVTLNGANDDPIALSDSNGTAKNSTLSVSAAKGVLANDTDPDVHDNGHLGVTAVSGSGANVGHSVAGHYGSLTLNDDGSYVYVANQGSLPAKIVAQDTFQYTISDPHGGTDTANLYIVVFNPGTNYIAGINTTLNGGNGPDVVDGFAGHDIVLGGNGPDVLIGGNGDTLTGGNGPDTYLFREHFGANTITDFDTHNDNMQFDKSIFTSAADILANHTTDTAAGAVISDGLGDAITLLGVHQSQLSADMFMLV